MRGARDTTSRAAAIAAAAGVLALGTALSACSDGQPGQPGQPAGAGGASAGQFTTGPAVNDFSAYGQTFRPCTGLEVEGYPGYLTRPSSQYYQGPWCATVQGSTVYLWAFARIPQRQVSDAQIANEVNLDVDQMRRDLEAQGYRRVCGNVADDGDVDEGFERDGAAMSIRLVSSGEPQPRAAASGASAGTAEPLALRVVLAPSTHRRAIEPDAAAPPC